MIENLPNIGFRAPRPPAPWSIDSLAKSLSHDIHYKLPSYFRKGIGDTYFSGKMLAKLGRILMVAEEVKELCDEAAIKGNNGYEEVCEDVTLPSDDQMTNAVNNLRSSVEIWINGTGATPFVFDSKCKFWPSTCASLISADAYTHSSFSPLNYRGWCCKLWM
jgi:hypothetical protein